MPAIPGSIITPLGEEAFFRGVVANSLLARYGAWVGIVASAAIFAVAAGINPVVVVALIVGLLTALMFRWSRSIWPGIVLHCVNNSAALFLPLVIAAATTIWLGSPVAAGSNAEPQLEGMRPRLARGGEQELVTGDATKTLRRLRPTNGPLALERSPRR